MVQGELPRQPVELFGQDARLHVGNQHVQALGGEAAGAAHALEALGAVDLHAGGADRGEGGVGEAHGTDFPARAAKTLRTCIT